MLDSIHNGQRAVFHQSCGRFNFPDMVTVGMGGMSHTQVIYGPVYGPVSDRFPLTVPS